MSDEPLPAPDAADRLPDDELPGLIASAREAAERAYCPYSGFRVGAAIRSDRGEVFTGCNVENASYGLSQCAERVTIGHAVACGVRAITAVVVYTPTPEPTTPCGACRQVIREFGPRAEIICVCDGPDVLRRRVDELLPDSFGPDALRREA